MEILYNEPRTRTAVLGVKTGDLYMAAMFYNEQTPI